MRVVMPELPVGPHGTQPDAQLFQRLPPQARLPGFARVALAAREFPVARKVAAGAPLADEVAATRLNERDGDLQDGHLPRTTG